MAETAHEYDVRTRAQASGFLIFAFGVLFASFDYSEIGFAVGSIGIAILMIAGNHHGE